MSNNKQSSVEWFIEQYKKCFGPFIPLIMNNENEKAKEMHKEEIEKALKESRLTHPIIGFKHETFEKYYNETFGNYNGE